MAGEDAKALETLARYQKPADFLKAHNELRGKLSERQAPVRLADNATPEQVTEYRKSLGLPEIGTDAKPDDYMKAYKIEPPAGMQLNEMQKGMLGDFSKLAYEKGWSPAEIKGATDFYFQQEAANAQALNRAAVGRQKEWQNGLRDELGSREYEAQQAAATEWLKAQFGEDQDAFIEITRAQLPGGGYLGDHPWFFKTIAGLAMGDGYTDRIEAAALESTGKSLAQQQSEIDNLRFKDKAAYDEAMKSGGKYEKILSARMAKGEIDDNGNETKRRRSA